MNKYFWVVLFVALGIQIKGYAAEMPQDDSDYTQSDFEANTGLCDDLREKIDIFVSLQKEVSHDFAKIKDEMLCQAMVNQCEDFYSKTKDYQKLYRDHCDSNFEDIKLTKCDYSETPCTRVVAKAYDGLHAKSDNQELEINW